MHQELLLLLNFSWTMRSTCATLWRRGWTRRVTACTRSKLCSPDQWRTWVIRLSTKHIVPCTVSNRINSLSLIFSFFFQIKFILIYYITFLLRSRFSFALWPTSESIIHSSSSPSPLLNTQVSPPVPPVPKRYSSHYHGYIRADIPPYSYTFKQRRDPESGFFDDEEWRNKRANSLIGLSSSSFTEEEEEEDDDGSSNDDSSGRRRVRASNVASNVMLRRCLAAGRASSDSSSFYYGAKASSLRPRSELILSQVDRIHRRLRSSSRPNSSSSSADDATIISNQEQLSSPRLVMLAQQEDANARHNNYNHQYHHPPVRHSMPMWFPNEDPWLPRNANLQFRQACLGSPNDFITNHLLLPLID